MAEQKFERTMDLASDMAQSWAVLTDVAELASWASIIHSVKEVEHLRSYTAVLEDRVGPFSLRADLSIAVTVLVEGEALDVVASGRDRAASSRIDVEGHLRLSALPDGGTRLTVAGKYAVSGRVATFGAGIVRKKGDAAVEEFFGNAGRVLQATDAEG